MNRKLLISLLVMGLVSALQAQNYPYQNDLLWVTTPNNKEWLCQLNKEADVTRHYILEWIGKNLK